MPSPPRHGAPLWVVRITKGDVDITLGGNAILADDVGIERRLDFVMTRGCTNESETAELVAAPSTFSSEDFFLGIVGSCGVRGAAG